jgi:hypothetical protein
MCGCLSLVSVYRLTTVDERDNLEHSLVTVLPLPWELIALLPAAEEKQTQLTGFVGHSAFRTEIGRLMSRLPWQMLI